MMHVVKHYAPLFASKECECIDLAQHMPFLPGNALKYVWRAGNKKGNPADQDLEKAIDYLERWEFYAEKYLADDASMPDVMKIMAATFPDEEAEDPVIEKKLEFAVRLAAGFIESAMDAIYELKDLLK